MRQFIFPGDKRERDEQYRELTQCHAFGVGKRTVGETRCDKYVNENRRGGNGQQQKQGIKSFRIFFESKPSAKRKKIDATKLFTA
ncbi:MAG: hypothetical protein IPN58_18390 [Anaerolineales bacterium]|nr:hypothetical protein [Anaerolineales bacterium]